VKGFLVNDANPRRQYAEGGPDDETDPYVEGGYYQQQPYGYDAYGRPLQAPPAPQPQQAAPQPQQPYYDPSQQGYGGSGQPGRIPRQPQQPYYEQAPQQQGYAPPGPGGGNPGRYPGYETGQQPPVYDTGPHPVYPGQGYETGQQPPLYDTGQYPGYETGQQPPVYDTGRQAPVYDTGQQQPVYDTGQQAPVYDTGQQAPVHETGQQPVYREEPAPGEYHTGQFAFLDEDSEESDEVIDWLKFSESRTERREETKRRSRNRKTGLVVILVLALLGGAGYLWQAGKIPGLKKNGASAAAAGGDQKRQVIVVHLLPVSGGPSSTALLVDNHTKKRGTTVLIPNSLQVTGDDGSTGTLDKSVNDGVGPTRDALNTLLGTDITGSWRLDSPYLELLVDSLGNVIVDTNTTVNGTGKDKGTVVVPKGAQQELSGQAAVAYATYRAPGEPQTAQLARFGQVMEAVLEKMPSDATDATKTVQSLAQILDPSLTEKQLGTSLAQLADLAKTGAYDTTTLAVQKDGTLSAQATAAVVKDVLGGAVNKSTSSSSSAQPRVVIKDATGNSKSAAMAQAAIVNGGTYTYVPGGKAATAQPLSQVLYADPAREAAAKDVATTLGLPASAVKKGTVPTNADISVVLGKNYKPTADEG
jgi:anionic cell wall polymer biosynthesis LytR-Cps2A-Psr (LCP) family protein